MDFFSKVKRAFGFTEDGSDFEDEIRVDSRTTPYVNPFRKDGVDKPAGAATQAASAQDTTSSASDAEVAALKEQMRQMMTMMRNMQAQQVRQAEMPQSLETLKTEPKPAKPHHREEQQDSDEGDIKQRLQLSEVQRRTAQERANALTEKIEQLQVRISTLENDKKGLLNKIRVMEVKAGGNGSTETTDAIERMMEQHHEELAEKDQLIEQVQQKLVEANATIEALNVEMQGAARAADERSQEAMAKLQQQVEETTVALTAKHKEIAALQQQVEAVTRETAAKDQEMETLKAELQEANDNLEIAAQVQKKLDEVEQFKERKNAEIAQLKTEVERLSQDEDTKERLEQAEQDNARLNKTIEQMKALAKETA